MSIGKRISEAIDKLVAKDHESALISVSIAIDATATRYYGKRGRKSYKDFVRENLGLINLAAGGIRILNLRMAYKHPEIACDAEGYCTIQDILYHAVRCGLTHTGELPANLTFVEEGTIAVNENGIVLPVSMIRGLLIAVVVCPCNKDEKATKEYAIGIHGFQIQISKLWGKKTQLEGLFAAMDELL